MEYIEVNISIAPYTEDNADIVLAEIESLGFDSFLNEDPYLKAYIPSEKFSEAHLKVVLSAFRGGEFAVAYTLNLVPEQNWNAAWESDFQPVVIDRLCTIKAPYHHGLPRTRYSITIKPDMAFGTGHHQTTTMMVEYLLEEAGLLKKAVSLKDAGTIEQSVHSKDAGTIEQSVHSKDAGTIEQSVHSKDAGLIFGAPGNSLKGKQLLDMGCGTGILSILAAKLHAISPVHAIDIDPIAVRSAQENSFRNRVSDRIHTLCGDASLIQAGKYDYILANINRNILLEDMSTYVRGLSPTGGTLIISGFFLSDIPLLVSEAQRLGLSYISRRENENWAAVKFAK